MRWIRSDGYRITDATADLDRDTIHGWLSSAYWTFDIPREVLDRAIEGSLCFGIYDPGGRQAGFCRVITDMATFAWIGDVFVAEDQRGRGLGIWLMEVVAAHPQLQGLRRGLLATRDAHDLYRKTGFAPLTAEESSRMMTRPSRATYGPGAIASDTAAEAADD